MIHDSFLKNFRETKSPFITNPYRFAAAEAGIGGWVELGRTTLGSAGDNITVSSLDNKRYYMMLYSSNNSTGRIAQRWRFNSDTGSNYSYRRSRDGSEASSGNKTSITWGESIPSGWDHDFSVNYVSNLSNKEKLALGHCVHSETTGASNIPKRTEAVGKWVNTSNAINSITAYNASTGSFGSGDEVVVLGWDPDDTHTTNFWEELVNTTQSSASTTFSSGTFTAKKYLWIQAWIETASASAYGIRLGNSSIDTGSNYAYRLSANGASDSTGTSQTNINTNTAAYDTKTFVNLFVINNTSNEKLIIGHTVGFNAAGATSAPNRVEWTGKWANTSNQADEFAFFNVQSQNIQTTSKMVIWGAD